MEDGCDLATERIAAGQQVQTVFLAAAADQADTDRPTRSGIGIVVLQIKPTAGAFGLPLISQVRAGRTDHNIIGPATIDSRVIRNGINCNGGCACRQR